VAAGSRGRGLRCHRSARGKGAAVFAQRSGGDGGGPEASRARGQGAAVRRHELCLCRAAGQPGEADRSPLGSWLALKRSGASMA